MTDTCRALDRYVDKAPTVFRIRIPVSQAEMNQLRPHFLPDESATHAILRLALERVHEIGHEQRQALIARAEDTLARVDQLLADDAQEVG